MKLTSILKGLAAENNQNPDPPAFEVVKEFQSWLTSIDFDNMNRWTNKGCFYPSGFAYECDRSLALGFLSTPQGFVSRDARLQVTFEMGHGIHAQLQNLFRKWAERKGWEFADEVRILRTENPWFVQGRIDGVFYIPKLDERRAVEIKSINDSGFQRLWSKPTDPHLEQGNTYLGCSATSKCGRIDRMHYIYVNKNTSAMKEFDVAFDPELFRATMTRIERIVLGLQQGKLPECDNCTRACGYNEFNAAHPGNGIQGLTIHEDRLKEIGAFKPHFIKLRTKR